MTDSDAPDRSLTVAELHQQVRYLCDNLAERMDMTPRQRGQIVGARDMATAIEQMITRVHCTCDPEHWPPERE